MKRLSHARTLLSFATAFLILALTPDRATGSEIVGRYQGTANPSLQDPTAQGWADFGVQTADAAAVVDGATQAWSIDDADGGAIHGYTVTPTPDQITDAQGNGWTMSLNLRIVDQTDSPDFNIAMGWRNDAGRIFTMTFGASNGDPVVVLHPEEGAMQGDPTFKVTLDNAGDGYHRYELVYNPITDVANLFVDGNPTPVISNYPGYVQANTMASPFVAWGDRTGTDTTGHCHYNLLEFAVHDSLVVPALPTWGFGLLVMALCAVAAFRLARVGSEG
jgi:hypothetical protein